MKNWKKFASMLLALVLCLCLAACGEAEEDVIVTVANQSGQDITSLSIAATTSDEWGEDFVHIVFQDGELMEVSLGAYKPSELPGFNILAYGEDGDVLYDTNAEFTVYNGDYIILESPYDNPGITICTEDEFYDLYAEYYPVVDEEPVGYPEEELQAIDISGFTGCWKMVDAQFYFVINDSFEWVAINLYGEEIGPGYVVAEEDCITLYMEDGSELVSLWQTGEGDLCDAGGSVLTPMDYIMLLPTPEDALNQTAYFSDGFANVSIDYPIQMYAYEHPNVDNSVSFDAVMEDGTDDYYSNILIAFQPISGYDPYMEQGAATAKTYMVKMLDDFMNSMYGSHLIKSFGSDFKDNGDYYSLTGYMWLDGSIFADGPSQPVRGCMEVRYYGPTGYALVATTVALESRIRNYFDICNNMLTTLSYSTGWSTAPKSRPAQPAYSGDTGDYGTPYYWYDEDGDIWYWNGYENIFMGYGSDGYIDSDSGEYMESNDAGWDYDDEYYDDYDPWSDPGDGWDAWSDPGDYYDDGWGDYFG